MAIVYEHLRNDTNEVFYVGIGVKKGRAFEKHKRNPHWHNIVKKAGYTVNIVYKDIEHDEAKQIEMLLIEKYGRKDLGLGNLVNMTDGGDGALGLTHSEEARQKMSKALKGENNPNFGKTTSEETREKMSEAHKGEKHHMFGKKHSNEVKQKLSEALKGEKSLNFGKTFSEETRQKMSESKKGIPSPNKGKTRSEEDKQKISKGSKCRKGVKGYYFNKASKKWIANIFSNKKRISLGSFNTPGEAAEAYQKARLIYFV